MNKSERLDNKINQFNSLAIKKDLGFEVRLIDDNLVFGSSEQLKNNVYQSKFKCYKEEGAMSILDALIKTNVFMHGE